MGCPEPGRTDGPVTRLGSVLCPLEPSRARLTAHKDEGPRGPQTRGPGDVAGRAGFPSHLTGNTLNGHGPEGLGARSLCRTAACGVDATAPLGVPFSGSPHTSLFFPTDLSVFTSKKLQTARSFYSLKGLYNRRANSK